MKRLILVLLSFTFLAGSDYFQQEVNYTIQVSLDDEKHTLAGDLSLIYKNNSNESLEFIWFHLWPNAYKNTETAFARQKLNQKSSRFQFSKEKDKGYIDSLDFQVDGNRVKMEFHPEWIDVAKIYLNSPINPGESITITTPFFVKLPQVFSRLGHTGNHYEITQWYPKPAVYDMDGWHPMPYLDQGEFYSEFGTFDVFITLPENYRIMATGDLINGENEYAWLDSLAILGDKLSKLSEKEFKKEVKRLKKENKNTKSSENLKTLHFHQKNVHDFAWFADRDWIVRKGELYLADSTRSVTLWSMYLPKNAKLWNNSLEFIHDAGYWYSEFLGDYPYNHITAVDGDLSAGGGMEYPNITVISSSGSEDLLEFVIMHEVGHNWFYGILGSNEREYTWIDEGFNEWMNHKYWEAKYSDRDGAKLVLSDGIQNKARIGKNLSYKWVQYMLYTSQAVTGDEQALNQNAGVFNSRNYGAMNYAKTGIYGYYLDKYLGYEVAEKILHEFYETWKFKHPKPSDFETIVYKYTDKNLDWFFNDMVSGKTFIDYAAYTSKGQFFLENKGTSIAPVEIAFYTKDKELISREWLDGFSGIKEVVPPENAHIMIIDPDEVIPDIFRANNSIFRDIKFNFGWDVPNYYDREINILPWLFSFNEYNGISPGVQFYYGNSPGYTHGFSALPMWDINNKRLVGKVNAQKTFYRLGLFKKINTSVSLSDYEGRKGLSFNFEGNSRSSYEKYPEINTNFSLFYHDLNGSALNPNIYKSGEFIINHAELNYSAYPSYFLSYNSSIELETGLSGANFIKLGVTNSFKYRFTNKIQTTGRIYLGGFLVDSDIPRQYSIFMNGGVDPNFTSIVFDRTDAGGKGLTNIGDEQYLTEGPGLHSGMPITSSKEIAWGFNFTQSSPIPLSLYIDIAGATDLNDNYVVGGLSYSMGPMTVYFPLFQNWSDNKTPTDLNWVIDKAQFKIEMSSIILF